MNGETYQSTAFDIGPELPINLSETYSDVDMKSSVVATVSGIMPGMVKWVNADIAKYTGKLKGPVLIYGPALVSLVCNRSGGTLSQGALTKWYTLGSITFTAGSVTTGTHAGKFVANEEVGNFVYILDDAGAGGAAPEGECRLIIKNTANVLTVQPAFSAAIANGDTAQIFSRSMVIAGASGDTRAETAGIVVAPDGIADNYWGFVVRYGIVGALVKASTAITAARALIADTGRLTISNSSGFNLTLGHSIVGSSSDIVSDLIPVNFDAWAPQAVSA
jgi:hypothetical protein